MKLPDGTASRRDGESKAVHDTVIGANEDCGGQSHLGTG